MKKLLIILLFPIICQAGNGGTAFQYSSANSGTITAYNTGQDVLLVQEGTLSVSLTISFPASPVNGQRFSFSSTGGMTTLSLTTPIGSIVNALTTMAAGGSAEYTFSTGQNKWYKTR